MSLQPHLRGEAPPLLSLSRGEIIEIAMMCIDPDLSVVVNLITDNAPRDGRRLAVRLISDIGSFSVSAHFIPSLAMIIVPREGGWEYPLTLFIEPDGSLVGTLDRDGCHMQSARFVRMHESSRQSIRMKKFRNNGKFIELNRKFEKFLNSNKNKKITVTSTKLI